MQDIHQLQRFVNAQEGVYARVCEELRSGSKRSHWMWFIFPQLAGLGRSEMAARYAISSVDEARAYLAHPLLGARLRECAGLAAALRDKSAAEVFGHPDVLKFHSSLTLFAFATGEPGIFDLCLQQFFDSKPDAATLALIHAQDA